MNGSTEEISNCLVELAKLLSDDHCIILPNEILENIKGQSISEEDAGDIGRYLIASGLDVSGLDLLC